MLDSAQLKWALLEWELPVGVKLTTVQQVGSLLC
jgi:hypothetical protein